MEGAILGSFRAQGDKVALSAGKEEREPELLRETRNFFLQRNNIRGLVTAKKTWPRKI